MTKSEMKFFILLLESYSFDKNESPVKILDQWRGKRIVKYINDSYEMYHTERLENAFEDIDKKLES
jgi:hypothetical protein